MALRSTRGRVALVKMEATYGVDSVPAAANAMLLMESQIAPAADKLERKLDLPYFTGDPFVLVGKRVELTAKIDLLGALVLGNAAPLGPLYRITGHSETLNAIALATPVNSAFSTAAAGGTLAAGTYFYRVSAINALGETLASAETSQVTVGATSTVTVNWGAVAGATGYKIYGRATGAEQLLATVGAVTTFTDTGAAVPSGALPTANTTAGAKYAPISRNFESASIYFFWAGVLCKMAGVRGTLDIDQAIKSYSMCPIKLTGLFSIPSDGEAPVGIDWTPFQTPSAIETESWAVTIDNGAGVFDACAQQLTLNSNAQVKIIECANAREVVYLDRKPTGTLRVFKDTTLAAWNPWAIADQQKVVTLTSTITRAPGLNVLLPIRAQLEYPKPVDIDGVAGFEIPFTAIASGAGGDEYTFQFT